MKASHLMAALVLMLSVAPASASEVSAPPSHNIHPSHPRLFFTREMMDDLRSRLEKEPVREIKQKFLRWVDRGGERWNSPNCADYAFAYQITQKEAYVREAVRRALEQKPIRHFGADPLALAYDWCCDKFTEAQRVQLRKTLAEAAVEGLKGLTWGPSFHENQRYVGPWMSQALAVAGEEGSVEPSLDWFAQNMPLYRRIFDDVRIDGGMRDYQHQAQEKIWPLEMWSVATGEDLIRKSRFFRGQGIYWIYRLLGGPHMMPNVGDGGTAAPISQKPSCFYFHRALRNRDPYSQTMALMLLKKSERTTWADVLWCHPEIEARPLTELPGVRLFRGVGVAVMRSGWDTEPTSEDIVAVFYCGPYPCHGALNQNHFSIWRGQENLTPDGGFYDYCAPRYPDGSLTHWVGYYHRTISHNSILIRNPNDPTATVANDGGQGYGVPNRKRWPYDTFFPLERGENTAFGHSEHYTYILGDATRAYDAQKDRKGRLVHTKTAEVVTRQFLWLKPDIFVVYDRVVSTDTNFKKTWLLQSYDEPSYDGSEKVIEGAGGDGISESSDTNLITSTREKSVLFCRILLPEKHIVRKVGGPKYHSYVDGKFFPARFGKAERLGPEGQHAQGMPFWRSEIMPAERRKEDVFLVVLRVGEKGMAPGSLALGKVRPEGDEVGLSLSRRGLNYEITFHRSSDGGHIRIMEAGSALADEDFPDRIDLPEGNPVLPRGSG